MKLIFMNNLSVYLRNLKFWRTALPYT